MQSILLERIDKHIQVDEFTKGCDPTKFNMILVTKQAMLFANFDDMIKTLYETYALSDKREDYVGFEDGEVIYQQMENEDGTCVSTWQYDQWKCGDRRLFNCTYHISIMLIEKMYKPNKKKLCEVLEIKDYDASGECDGAI